MGARNALPQVYRSRMVDSDSKDFRMVEAPGALNRNPYHLASPVARRPGITAWCPLADANINCVYT